MPIPEINDENDEEETLNAVEVIFRGKKMHGQTALTLAGNGGKTRRPATSRASRFFGYVQKPVTLQ